MRGELLEVAVEPRQLLGDVALIRKDDDLFHQPLIVNRQVDPGAMDALLQRLPVTLHHARHDLAHLLYRIADELDALLQILRQIPPLRLPHLHQLPERRLQRDLNVRPCDLRRRLLLRRAQDARCAEDCLDGNLPADAKFLL